MIVGLDIGNITTVGYTNNNSIIIESRISLASDINTLGNDEIITFNDEKYILNRGEFENALLKFEKENFLKLVFFALYKTSTSNKNKVSIGIPAGQYNKRKDELRKLLLKKPNCFKE